MTGRRLGSIAGVLVGITSFFLPLIVISLASQAQLKWSGYSLTTQIVGFTSENFWDIATDLVYGNESGAETKSAAPVNAEPHTGSTTGVATAFTMVAMIAVAYVLLIVLCIVVLAKYSPGRVSGLSLAGLVAALVALISFFIFADSSSEHFGGASTGGISNIDAGVGLYTLVACFLLIFLVQRLSVLDRALTAPE